MESMIDLVKYCETACRCNEEKCDRSKCPIWVFADTQKSIHKPLTLEDFKQSMHTPVWFESHGTYKGHKGWWMIPQRIQD